MAIEQFVKHIESLHEQPRQCAGKQKSYLNGGPIKSVSHLSKDLIRLKDLLKKAMDKHSSSQ